MTYRIRTARPDEYDVVGALTVRAYAAMPGFGADADAYAAELADVAGRAATCEVLVAVDDRGTVLGAVTYVPGPGAHAEFCDPDGAGIRMLAVDAGAVRRGIGAALTRACLDRAEASGRGVVVLHTADWNAGAQRLYARLGFRRAPARDLRTPGGTLLLGFEWRSGDAAAAGAGRRGVRPAAVGDVEVCEVAPDDPRVAKLIDALMCELADRYGGEDEDPFRPWDADFAGGVLLATVAGEPAGTVTLRPRPGGAGTADDAEIKRMYVAPAHRGTGVGRALLDAFEDLATRRGHARVVLETGTRQPEAMGLYAAAGYEPIEKYGWYRDAPLSRCFAKELDGVKGTAMHMASEGAGTVELRCDGVAFDADGVLVDSLAAVDDAWRAFCADYGLDPAEVLPGIHGVRAVESLRRFLPEEEVDGAFRQLVEREVATAPETQPLPGAARLLAELDHAGTAARCVVVTSGTRRLALARLEGSELGRPRLLVTADDVEQGKPHPAPYLRGAQLLGLDPGRVVVFEDAPSGVAAAKAAGCTTVALRTTHPGQLDADHRVDDLAAVEIDRDGAALVVRLRTS